jgi:hypothetical protein
MTEVTEQMVRRRAYEIWVEEGGESPESNWERAEQELRAALNGAASEQPDPS